MLHADGQVREALAQPPDASAILERLLAARRISLATARRRVEQTGAGRAAAAPCRAHAARIVERGVPRAGGATVTAVTLASLAPDERAVRLGKAPAQVRVVRYLEELGHPVLEGELLSACECGTSVVGALARKGLVNRFQQNRQTTLRRWELAPPPVPQQLTPHQKAAFDRMVTTVGAQEFRAFLLLGVTGSGKTEVYLRLAAAAVEGGLQSVIMVPEIGLTPALAGQLYARFGERAVVVHSSMAEGERFAAWERARRGRPMWFSAHAPRCGPPCLGSASWWSTKSRMARTSRERIRGTTRATWRSCSANSSAFPCCWRPPHRHWRPALAQQGKLEILELPERVAGGQLPTVELVNLCHEAPEPGEHGQRFLLRRARELLGERLTRGEQTILLVNRRGWAPVILCRECGFEATCPACSIPMTVHRKKGRLLCHYCGQASPIPTACPRCGGEVLDDVGAGTEKIESLIQRTFPQARVAVLDRDTARSPAQLVATLEGFAAGTTDVLVGTQMVSKGHHFPGVTLTIVVNADNLLGFPDFRGAERTFQMLTQVAGRAGRGEQPGEVLIQTYHPDHHAVRAAVNHDVMTFATEELSVPACLPLSTSGADGAGAFRVAVRACRGGRRPGGGRGPRARSDRAPGRGTGPRPTGEAEGQVAPPAPAARTDPGAAASGSRRHQRPVLAEVGASCHRRGSAFDGLGHRTPEQAEPCGACLESLTVQSPRWMVCLGP